MIDFTPGPVAFQLGPITFPWYGVGYALGLFVAAWVIMREAKRRGFDPDIVPNGMVVVAVEGDPGVTACVLGTPRSNAKLIDPEGCEVPGFVAVTEAKMKREQG